MTRTEFDNLVVTSGRKLYGQACRILGDREESEDAVQEVFVRLWKMKMRLDEYKSVEALAVTMIKNYCIDQLRKRKYIDPGGEMVLTGLHDSAPSPQELIERKEASDIMIRIIGELPKHYSEVIRMRDMEELSFEEIAEITGQNINTVRVSLSRARKSVRDEFRKQTK